MKKGMKKVLSVLLAVLMLASVASIFAACSKEKDDQKDNNQNNSSAVADLDLIKQKGKLVVGVTDYKPIDYKDANGNWTGFDAEFAAAFAKSLGVDVEFVEIKWENKFIELDSKTIDIIWNGMTISDSVKANCDVSDAYASNSQVVVMKADKAVDSTDALKDLAIAVEKGSAGETEAKKYTSNIVSLTGQADALKEVKAGTADACIIDSTMANSMTAEGTDFADLTYKLSLTTEEYGIGLRKGSDMLDTLNKFIAQSKTDGTLDDLSDKYGVDIAK